MTGNDKRERNALNRLADALVDDILNTSDEDILAEFRDTHGDPDRHAAEMRELFEKSILIANKKRLAAAKAGAAARRKPAPIVSSGPIDMEAARARLRAIANTPGIPQRVTLAARKENELSDNDILGMLDDLRELGVLPPDDQGGKR